MAPPPAPRDSQTRRSSRDGRSQLPPRFQKGPQWLHQITAIDRVALQHLPFAIGGRSGLVEHRGGDEDFSDVVKKGTPADFVDLLGQRPSSRAMISAVALVRSEWPRVRRSWVFNAAASVTTFSANADGPSSRWAARAHSCNLCTLALRRAAKPRGRLIGKDEAELQQHRQGQEAPAETLGGGKSGNRCHGGNDKPQCQARVSLAADCPPGHQPYNRGSCQREDHNGEPEQPGDDWTPPPARHGLPCCRDAPRRVGHGHHAPQNLAQGRNSVPTLRHLPHTVLSLSL